MRADLAPSAVPAHGLLLAMRTDLAPTTVLAHGLLLAMRTDPASTAVLAPRLPFATRTDLAPSAVLALRLPFAMRADQASTAVMCHAGTCLFFGLSSVGGAPPRKERAPQFKLASLLWPLSDAFLDGEDGLQPGRPNITVGMTSKKTPGRAVHKKPRALPPSGATNTAPREEADCSGSGGHSSLLRVA